MPRKMLFDGRGVPILLVALLQLVLYSIPTADAFSAIKVPCSTWNQRKDAHRSTSLSSQRPPGGFDPSYARLSEQEEEVDQYLASLKRGQAPPPQAAAPRVLTPEERKAVNDAAKARMEAYQRGELPPGMGQSTLPPPPHPYGYRHQPQSPPPGYAAASSPEAAQPKLSPSGTPGFNPNYWSDALREFEAKQAAEKAQQEAEEAAAANPSSPPPPPPPPQQQQQQQQQQHQQQQPQEQYQQQERSTDESSGGSRFKALLAAQEAQKNNGGAASPKERLKQFLLSKYAPDDMSEQAVTYRRLIQFADSGYSGPPTEDKYMAKLKQEAKEKAAQRLRAVGLTDDAAPPVNSGDDPYGSSGPSSPPLPPPPAPGSYGEKGINAANSYMDALTSKRQDRAMGEVSPPPAQQQKAYDYPLQAPLSPPPQQQQQGYGYPDPYAANTPPAPPTYAQPAPSQPSPQDPYAYVRGYPPQAAAPYQQAPPPPPPPVLTYVPPPPPPPVQQQQQQQQQSPSAAVAPKSMSPGLQNSVHQLEAYLQRHQSHRLQGQDLDRMEELLSLVKAGLATEANIGAKRVVSSSSSDPEAPPSATAALTDTASSRSPPVYDTSYGEAPPFLGVQERKVLINLAKALEVTAYARDEAEVKSKLAWLSNMMQIATGMVDGWMKGGLGGTSTPSTQQQASHSSSPPSPPPVYEQRPPPQQQSPPPPGAAEAVVEERQHTPPSPPAVPAASKPDAEAAPSPPPPAAAAVPPSSSSRQVTTEKELSKEDRAKLQGAMALVLKNSGAFGKMSGPLMGEELDLMRSALGDVAMILRTETEEVYGQSVEEYLQANPQAIEEMEAARLAAIETSSPSIPKIETAIKPQISYKDMLKQAREKKTATPIMVDSAANDNNNKEEND